MIPAVYTPTEDLALAGGKVPVGWLREFITYNLVPLLGLIDLQDLKYYIERRIEALEGEKADTLIKEGWWVSEFGTPDAALNAEETYLVAGVKHPDYNPKGGAQKINAIKSVRARLPVGLKEAKDLVDAFQHQLESGEIELPESIATKLRDSYSIDCESLEEEDLLL